MIARLGTSASSHRSILGWLLFAVTVQAAVIQEVLSHNEHAHRGHTGGVACESRECSAIGRDILERGGNAVDALVGTTFCVGVIGSYHSGIGGGGFAIIRDANGSYEAVDFRETAPAAASEDMFKDNVVASIRGGLAVAVPGEVRGLGHMHSKYGALPWKTIMQGAIDVARNGFKVSKDTVFNMNKTISSDGQTYLVNDPTWAAVFAPQGRLLKEGETLRRTNYANTLEIIAEQGPEVFYTGEMAETMADFVQQNGGILTTHDLHNYTVLGRPVRTIDYRGLKLHSIGSPAGGVVSLQILKMMEHYDPVRWAADEATLLSLHRLTEAMRFAYAARSQLGDPGFVASHDVEALEGDMLDPAHVADVVARISDRRSHSPSYYYGPDDKSYVPDGHGTSHIVAADRSGLVVSLTTTVNLIFGAQIMEPKTGIILNNEMNDFSIPGVPNEFGFAPSEANYIRPGKRPLSSIAPIIADYANGTLFAVVGAAGGSRIISASAQSLWHLLDHGMTAAQALAAPRLHDQLSPNVVLIERPFGQRVWDFLGQRRHIVRWAAPLLSAAQAIVRWPDGSFEAASEPRQENSAGYAV